MPIPEAFSERKSSSMMTMGNWKRSIGGASRRAERKRAQCRAGARPSARSNGRLARGAPYTGTGATTEEIRMDLSNASVWWVAAGVAVAAELGTGTFYLLMIALGLVAGAIAAHLGLGAEMQLLVAAIVGGGATAVWHW